MSSSISPSAKIYDNVILGDNVIIEDFCIIGAPPMGKQNGELQTVIGDHAIIRSHTVIYAGNHIGESFQTGNKTNIRESNQIGSHVSIGTLSVIEHHVTIEDHSRIHTQVFIPEYSTLRHHSWIGPNVVFTNAMYPTSQNVKSELKGPTIEPYARVGANSTLLPGVQIGENALIGAGSVVTQDISDHAVAFGNPAKVRKTLEELPCTFSTTSSS